MSNLIKYGKIILIKMLLKPLIVLFLLKPLNVGYKNIVPNIIIKSMNVLEQYQVNAIAYTVKTQL